MNIAAEYRPAWAEPSFDLEKYDAPLDALGQVYTDIYL